MTDCLDNYISANTITPEIVSIISYKAKEIQDGRATVDRFNLHEHDGLRASGGRLIGAYLVACFARRCVEAGCNAAEGTQFALNIDIDQRQELFVEQFAKATNCWFEHSEELLIKNFGPQIAEGAEAKVFYRGGENFVVKERASIYATLQKAFEAIVLHNTFFPETTMKVVGFTRDSDGIFRIVLTQPYIACARLATKAEIDDMVLPMGFSDNYEGLGVNYINDRIKLEDLHPANVFIDSRTQRISCIDCIAKFIEST